nr:sulfite exporter TauE/SafE family protein [Kushneria phosphatilytica]
MPAEPLTIVTAMAIALLAGVTRGYCGFGFAMLVALGLSGFMAPVEAVPVALLLDLLAAAGLLQVAARHAHRRVLGRLVLGMLLAVGLGVWLLSRMPAAPMRMVIALLSLSGGMALLCRVGRRDVVPEEGPLCYSRAVGDLGRRSLRAGDVHGLGRRATTDALSAVDSTIDGTAAWHGDCVLCHLQQLFTAGVGAERCAGGRQSGLGGMADRTGMAGQCIRPVALSSRRADLAALYGRPVVDPPVAMDAAPHQHAMKSGSRGVSLNH